MRLVYLLWLYLLWLYLLWLYLLWPYQLRLDVVRLVTHGHLGDTRQVDEREVEHPRQAG